MNQDLGNMEILILDDDSFQLKVLDHQLRSIGLNKVSTFADGQSALDRLQDESMAWSLIILDLNMPGMDGVEFLVALRETPFDGHIILLSGEDIRIMESTRRMARAYNLSILDHLQKPVEKNDLARVLEKLPPARTKQARPRDTGTNTPINIKSIARGIRAGEFFNVYQPKVCLDTGELAGFEALVRWALPDGKTVFPDEFIGIAEDNGLIDDLLWDILERALRDQQLWKHQGIETRVAVNISMDNLTSRNFISQVENALAKYDAKPEDLILEVTESKLMREFSMVLNILTSLRLRRIKLSIDDFGTGHSSMLQLRDIPCTELKLDRSYVHDAGSNHTLFALLDGATKTARDLGITTVAEGIENIQDWHCVRNCGCDYGQGYFIGKPMPVDALENWLDTWTDRMASEIT